MHSPPRILIVDDNETNRDILHTRLSIHGYDLKQACDGEEALAAAKELLPDLMLRLRTQGRARRLHPHRGVDHVFDPAEPLQAAVRSGE